jgi:cytoskeletal protein CcmA (bactofilin family)
MDSSRSRSVSVCCLVVVVLVSLVSGTAAAQEGVRGTVTVAEGETVSEVNAVAGTIRIDGTVTGDVSGLAGNVVIDGIVEGDVSVATGNLFINGQVGGDVASGAGNVVLGPDSSIGGDLELGAGTVRIDGSVEGDATIGADTIRLGEAATIGGSLRYDGTLEGNREAVAGDIVQDATVSPGLVGDIQPLAQWVFAIYAFLLNLLLGAVLVGLFPGFSARVVDQITDSTGRTALAGLGVCVGILVVLVVTAISIVGLPITVASALAFAFVAWIALVYGRFALGMWLLSYTDVDNRWLGLGVGLLAGAAAAQLPIVGGLATFLLFVLGLGALSIQLYAQSRRPGVPSAGVPPEESPAD